MTAMSASFTRFVVLVFSAKEFVMLESVIAVGEMFETIVAVCPTK